MGYYFCVNNKISKNLSEHKVLPRNKSFKEILSFFISGKIPAVDEKQIF